MQLKPGDIVSCTWSDMWPSDKVGRSRFIVLEVFENDGYCSIYDDDDCFLSVDDYIRAYCYDFEDHPEAVGETFNLPGQYLHKIEFESSKS